MGARPPHRTGQIRPLLLARVLFAAFAATALAQNAPTNFTAKRDIILSTKTPLGDASVTVPAGTVFTNCEVQGDKAKIWQGPFGATIDLTAVQPMTPDVAARPEPSPAPGANPEPSPAPSPSLAPAPEPQPSPSPTTPASLASVASFTLPDWALPAGGGALVAYAIFATLALIRARRHTDAPPAPAGKTAEMPVIILPAKATAKPALVSDGGRAIACPLCAKNIPMEKILKGRNLCPSCRGAFVCE